MMRVRGIIQALFACKRFAIKKSGIMEFVDNHAGNAQLGGMENLKVWLEATERAFGVENLNARVNLPKGVLIMGIAGVRKIPVRQGNRVALASAVDSTRYGGGLRRKLRPSRS